ncbi:MAG TPA: hypothetical protein VK472_03335 [Allosphingosinicella sp.]|jgi:hypothetical protein|nr:hypothetical protein [Allosphingosinicella sp.]
MRKVILATGLAATMALAGCGDSASDGSPTAEENRQLNEAAEMLDTSPDDLVPAEEAELGNGDEDSVEENEAVVNEAAGNAAAGNGQ